MPTGSRKFKPMENADSAVSASHAVRRFMKRTNQQKLVENSLIAAEQHLVSLLELLEAVPRNVDNALDGTIVYLRVRLHWSETEMRNMFRLSEDSLILFGMWKRSEPVREACRRHRTAAETGNGLQRNLVSISKKPRQIQTREELDINSRERLVSPLSQFFEHETGPSLNFSRTIIHKDGSLLR